MNGPQVHISALTHSTMHILAHTLTLRALYHATQAPAMCTRTRGSIMLYKTTFSHFNLSGPDLACSTQALQHTNPQALNQRILHENYTTPVGVLSNIHLRPLLHCVPRREYVRNLGRSEVAADAEAMRAQNNTK